METIYHISLDVPSWEFPFLASLSKKMGWALKREDKSSLTKKQSFNSSLAFVKSLSLHGKSVVPDDEDGRDARIEHLI